MIVPVGLIKFGRSNTTKTQITFVKIRLHSHNKINTQYYMNIVFALEDSTVGCL